MAVGKFDVVEQLLDNSGLQLNGGLVYTYEGGTTTNRAAYTSSTGGTAHANPIVLDSSGRPPGDGIWFTKGVAYKVVVKTSAGVTLETVDNLTLPDVDALITAATGSQAFDVAFYFIGGQPTSSQEEFRYIFDRAVTLPANFSGSQGSVRVNPTASYTETVKKNGSTIGTIVTNTSGTPTFATSGGAAASFAAGDILTVIAPSGTDATVAGIARTFKGTLA
jgi:hypothetical protein